MANEEERALEAVRVTKIFGELKALDSVSLAVRPGQIHGLVGHNGAGKSTLLRVLAGAIRPEEGNVRVGDRDVVFDGPAAAIRSGVGTVYQELSLLPNLTLAENTFLGAEISRAGFLRRKAMARETYQLLQRFGLDIDPAVKLSTLGVAQRQLVEIAVAVHRNARYLLLDEPTTSLEGLQVEKLLVWLRELADREKVGILFIGHKVNEVLAVSNHITALIDGKIALSNPVESVTRSDLISAITGQKGTNGGAADYRARRGSDPAVSQDPVLVASGLKTVRLTRVDLVARPGRVLGLYGLVGSGRSRFLRTLIGMEPIVDGSITLFGRPYQPRNAGAAAKEGVIFVTEDRKFDGFIPQLSAKVNVALPVLREFDRMGWLRRGPMRNDAAMALEALAVRGNLDGPMVRLSGGNQQKVLFARAIRQQPRVLLLDEPTKGVDIGAKGEIHRVIRGFVENNDDALVIVVSSEEEEILAIADDIMVFRGGVCDGTVYKPSALKAQDGSLRALAWHQEEVKQEIEGG